MIPSSKIVENNRLIILFGPQCSGKTTLVESLFTDENTSYISLGHEVRSMNDGNILKQTALELINNAKQWPAGLGLAFIGEKLVQSKSKITLLDGYPRNVGELIELVKFLKLNNLKLPAVCIEVTAPHDIVYSRYRNRLEHNNMRQESGDFFDLRYKQYEDFVPHMKKYCLENSVLYYSINTHI